MRNIIALSLPMTKKSSFISARFVEIFKFKERKKSLGEKILLAACGTDLLEK
jgi:hypothetical protein